MKNVISIHKPRAEAKAELFGTTTSFWRDSISSGGASSAAVDAVIAGMTSAYEDHFKHHEMSLTVTLPASLNNDQLAECQIALERVGADTRAELFRLAGAGLAIELLKNWQFWNGV